MNSRKAVLIVLLLWSLNSFSHWEASLGVGPAFPITGYGEVVETGVAIFSLGGNYRLNSGLSESDKLTGYNFVAAGIHYRF